jgi:two-component system, NtrC family, response regulator HydG
MIHIEAGDFKMNVAPKVLYIDDEEDLVAIAASFFEDENIPLDTTTSFHDALKMIKSSSYDIVISDAKMPTGHGSELFNKIRADGFKGKFIMVTGNIDSMDEVNESEYDLILYKPLRFQELIDQVKDMLVK